MNQRPDHAFEDAREPDARDEAGYEKLVDALDRGDLDAEFVAWAVGRELKRTGDAIADTSNDKAARVIYQEYAADSIHQDIITGAVKRHTFDEWLAELTTAPQLTVEIALILREEEESTNLLAGMRPHRPPDDWGWRPRTDFLAYQWERGSAER